MFARLFEMVSTRNCWAVMPVAAIFKARMVFSSCSTDHCLQGFAYSSVFVFKKALSHLVSALHLDHAGHLRDRIDIRSLQKPLKDATALDRLGPDIGAEHGAALADQVIGIQWPDQPDLANQPTL